MSLEVGIVGLPNVGKSTLFSALTKVQADAENYPFCTIEPNYGIVKLNDPRITRLAEIINPERIVPATLKGYVPLSFKGSLTTVPVDILLNENSVIENVHYGRNTTDHLSFEEILEFLNKFC